MESERPPGPPRGESRRPGIRERRCRGGSPLSPRRQRPARPWSIARETEPTCNRLTGQSAKRSRTQGAARLWRSAHRAESRELVREAPVAGRRLVGPHYGTLGAPSASSAAGRTADASSRVHPLCVPNADVALARKGRSPTPSQASQRRRRWRSPPGALTGRPERWAGRCRGEPRRDRARRTPPAAPRPRARPTGPACLA